MLCSTITGIARYTSLTVARRASGKGEELLACEQAGVTATLPKPQTSGAKSAGRFGKQDFVYLPSEDVYRCPVGETLRFHYIAGRAPTRGVRSPS